MEKVFKDVSVTPGESVWSVIDRLARMRGMFVHDDENGNLVLGRAGSGSSGATLQEGRNILAATCVIRDDSAFGKIEAKTQMRGDDNTDDEKTRKLAGSVDGSSDRHRPLLVPAEEPGDSDDMAARAQYERDVHLGSIIEVTVTVRGWRLSSGKLWTIRDIITCDSPMLLLSKVSLGIKTTVFSQADGMGTVTTLTLVRPEMLGAIEPGGRPGVQDGNVLPGGDASSQGQPEP